MKKRASHIRAPLTMIYLVIVLIAAGWASYTDVTLMHSQREHLAPDILLLIVTLPSSLSLSYLYDARPEFFSGPIAQVGWLTLCGLGQTSVVFALTRVFQKAVDARARR